MNKNIFFSKYNKLKKKKFKKFINFLEYKSDDEYREYLQIFSEILNNYHNLKLSKKNWSYIIGPWLKWILDVYNFKEMLTNKQDFFKNFYSKKKSNTILVVRDFAEVIDNSNNDLFNKSIFLNVLYGKKKCLFVKKKQKSFSFKNLIPFIRILVFRLSNFLKLKKNLIIIDHQNKNYNLKTKSLIFYPYTNLRNFRLFNKSFNSRINLINNLIQDKKKKYNNKAIFLAANIPLDYLENFKFVKFISSILFSGQNFYCRVAHLDNEYFKNYIAFKKNFSICLDQHGGNFSFVNKNLYYNYEKNVSKNILWWDKVNNKKYKSKFFSIRLNEIYSNKTEYNIKYNACYVISFLKKHDYQNEYHENYDYIFKVNQIQNFFKFFKNSSSSVVKMPPKSYNSQINRKDLQKLGLKKKQIITKKSSFFESEILIFEHLSTAIFETRNANTPFIIILDKKNFFLSKEGNYILNILKKENIYFSNGREAAIYLNKIINIENWWKQKKKILNTIFY